MDLMDQIRLWNDMEDYESIVNAIQDLDEDQITPELVSEVARAYINMGDGNDDDLHRMALDMLESVSEPLADDHDWNYRMGLVNYLLDREGDAVPFLRHALELKADDKDAQDLLDDCIQDLSQPDFDFPFAERVQRTWDEFASQEAQLRSMMEADMAGEHFEVEEGEAETPIELCDQILSGCFADSAFELGYDGKKFLLTLTADDGPAEVFKLQYFKDHAPESVLEHWTVNVGRQVDTDFTVEIEGRDLNASATRCWAKWDDDSVQVQLYAEELAPVFEAEEPEQAGWIMSAILDHTLGEICALDLIDSFEVVSEPRDTQGIPLSNLPAVLSKAGFDLSNDPARLTQTELEYVGQEPSRDEDDDWRLDITEGTTLCPVFMAGYLEDDDTVMNQFHNDGAVPGFLCWPIEAVEGKNQKAAVDTFTEKLEEAILKNAGSNAVTFIGHAVGLYAAYLDFIAWDLEAVLEAAEEAMTDLGMADGAFHTFRREAETLAVIGDDEDGEEGSDE